MLQGLVYLNNFKTVSCNLSPDNILIDPYGQAKLYNYGLYYMTEAGVAVSFPLGLVCHVCCCTVVNEIIQCTLLVFKNYIGDVKVNWCIVALSLGVSGTPAGQSPNYGQFLSRILHLGFAPTQNRNWKLVFPCSWRNRQVHHLVSASPSVEVVLVQCHVCCSCCVWFGFLIWWF